MWRHAEYWDGSVVFWPDGRDTAMPAEGLLVPLGEVGDIP